MYTYDILFFCCIKIFLHNKKISILESDAIVKIYKLIIKNLPGQDISQFGWHKSNLIRKLN